MVWGGGGRRDRRHGKPFIHDAADDALVDILARCTALLCLACWQAGAGTSGQGRALRNRPCVCRATQTGCCESADGQGRKGAAHRSLMAPHPGGHSMLGVRRAIRWEGGASVANFEARMSRNFPAVDRLPDTTTLKNNAWYHTALRERTLQKTQVCVYSTCDRSCSPYVESSTCDQLYLTGRPT